MSQSAMSMAAMAEAVMLPAGKKPPRNISCQSRSICIGFLPSRNDLRCSTAPATASSRLLRPLSPTPEMPSSVSTTTKVKFFLPGPAETMIVSTLVIFIRVSVLSGQAWYTDGTGSGRRLSRAPATLSLDEADAARARPPDALHDGRAGPEAPRPGIPLNHPEAIALICDEVLEEARAGRPYGEVLELGGRLLERADVMDGVPEMIPFIQVEALFPDGSKLLTIHRPIR